MANMPNENLKLSGCFLIAGAVLLVAILITQCSSQGYFLASQGEGKNSSPLFFVIIKLLGQTKTKTFGQVCPRKLAYTRLQLAKTAKLPLVAF